MICPKYKKLMNKKFEQLGTYNLQTAKWNECSCGFKTKIKWVTE